MKPKKIKFPKDELAHDKIIEWWYFNGHLKDEQETHYAYMNCLFKANVKKVNLPFLKKLPLKHIYFSHSLLTNLKTKKIQKEINPVALISRDSFTKLKLYINYTHPSLRGYLNYVIEKNSNSQYHIKNDYLDLILTPTKKPLLENGDGYVKLKSKATYYYSLTNLKTKGYILKDGKRIKVLGKSWMDHQWANVSHSNHKWTWFSIQLNNNIEIVCFEFDDGDDITNLASVIYANGRQEHTDFVLFKNEGKVWESPLTKAQYPLCWRIEMPSKKIKLRVKPIIKKQEMIFGLINYWEGPLEVIGLINNKKVTGQGFLELVGYPMRQKQTKIYTAEIKEQIKGIIKIIKKRGIFGFLSH